MCQIVLYFGGALLCPERLDIRQKLVVVRFDPEYSSTLSQAWFIAEFPEGVVDRSFPRLALA